MKIKYSNEFAKCTRKSTIDHGLAKWRVVFDAAIILPYLLLVLSYFKGEKASIFASLSVLNLEYFTKTVSICAGDVF